MCNLTYRCIYSESRGIFCDCWVVEFISVAVLNVEKLLTDWSALTRCPDSHSSTVTPNTTTGAENTWIQHQDSRSAKCCCCSLKHERARARAGAHTHIGFQQTCCWPRRKVGGGGREGALFFYLFQSTSGRAVFSFSLSLIPPSFERSEEEKHKPQNELHAELCG